MKQGLIIDNLSIGYGTKTIAQGISRHINKGKTVYLLGKNGCGKSTLLKTIAGFIPMLNGTIIIENRNLAELTQKELSRTVGIVQTGRIEELNLTVTDVVSMGRYPYTDFFGTITPTDRYIIDENLEKVGLTHLHKRSISTLSDGEYQKMMIARTLVQQTPLILMDEPTAFLDFQSKVEMLEMTSHLAHEENKTILITTHDVNLAAKLSDEIWIMQDSTIKKVNSLQEIHDFIGHKAYGYI